jgi:hypothetical protein
MDLDARAQEFTWNWNGLGSLAHRDMLYYNILMPDHHSHHHHAGHVHPPASVHPSILRWSAWQRLGFAGVLIALLWAATFWAMR